MSMEILTGSGGDSVLFAIYTGGDSVLVNKKEWGGFCPGGILSYTLREQNINQHEFGLIMSNYHDYGTVMFYNFDMCTY